MSNHESVGEGRNLCPATKMQMTHLSSKKSGFLKQDVFIKVSANFKFQSKQETYLNPFVHIRLFSFNSRYFGARNFQESAILCVFEKVKFESKNSENIITEISSFNSQYKDLRNFHWWVVFVRL